MIAVTGARGGIGAAIATALAKPGVVLALIGRDDASVQATAEACRARGAVAECFGADLSESTKLATLVSRIQEACGPIHTLVNNAGMFLEAPIL